MPRSSLFRPVRCLPALLMLAAACSDSTDPDGTAVSLAAVDGNDQAGEVSTALPAPLRVVVRDAAGNPVAGVDVDWSVVSGGGSVAEGGATGADGIASATFTLGPDEGAQQARAAVAGLDGSPVTFSATATAVAPGDIALVATVPVPPNYGVHDTYVRDGLAFVLAWDEGVYIYDVGNGVAGGSPSVPALVSQTVTAIGQDGVSPSAHNAWWFHNPNGEKRYLFVGEEGPGSVGTSSTGDIHVLDVTNLANPVEVATYHHPGVNGVPAGAHNFWMDETNAILYAAFYNGGVVALDVSGTLAGDLAGREIDILRPGNANTYVWGVMLGPDGSLYASDMVSGFWQLDTDGGTMGVAAGGNNVPERFGSDLWVHPGGQAAYTGTWGSRGGTLGNVIKVWALGPTGAPSLATSVTIANVTTISDLEVSADGGWMAVTTEYGTGAGLYLYDLANPLAPVLIDRYLVPAAGGGLHTGTIATIGGRHYVLAARDPQPVGPALLVFDVTDVVP